MSVVTGSTDGFLGGHTKMTPATVQPVARRRFATDVIASQFVVRVATETVVVGATTSIISSGATARVGDQILFTSGTLSGQTFTVVDQLSTTYTLGQEASSAPSGGDSFYVLRYRAPEVSSSGASVVDTELSDATLLANGDAIPTCGKVGAVVMGVNTSGTLDLAKLAKAHDLDTGAGTEYATGVSVRKSGSGGSTEVDFATQTTLAALLTELQLKADLSETQPVSAASLPLPTGAATSAKQDTIIGHVDGIEGSLTTLNAKDFATQTTLALIKAKTDNLDVASSTLAKEATRNLDGTATHGSRDLTSANTWYTVPSTVPTAAYVLIAQPRTGNAGTVRWSFLNSGTPAAGTGLETQGSLTLRLAANESVVFGSTTAGDDIDWTCKEVV